MIRPAFRERLLRRRLSTLRVIWACFAATVLAYVAVATWVVRTTPLWASDVAATLTPAMYAVAVAVALLSLWWRWRLMAPERMLADAMAPGAPTPPATKLVAETDAERQALAVTLRFQTHSIIVWAMSEALAVFGLVLSVGTGDARHATGLAAATLVLFGFHAPARRRLEAAVAAIPDR